MCYLRVVLVKAQKVKNVGTSDKLCILWRNENQLVELESKTVRYTKEKA